MVSHSGNSADGEFAHTLNLTDIHDNGHIEQKNWTHVCKLLGWDRYDSRAAVEAINPVYRQELRWWMNLYLPSVKLMKKVRVGSKLRRVYSPAQMPWERVLASGHADARRVAELKKLRSTLDPFALAQSIDRKLESIYALAKRRLSPKAANLCSATAVGVLGERSTTRVMEPSFHGCTLKTGMGVILPQARQGDRESLLFD